MTGLRFLWITKENPLAADQGARIYSNGLIRGLLGTGATGTLVAHEFPRARGMQVEGLTLRLATPLKRPRFLSLLTGAHSDAFRMQGEEITNYIREALQEQPDVVVIDYFAMGWALKLLDTSANRSRPAIVYVSHQYEPAVRREVARSSRNLFVRQILKHDAEKAVRLDRQLVQAADLITVNTDEDSRAYRKDVPDKALVTLVPAYDGEIRTTPVLDQSRPRRAVIVGALDWIAKQDALRRFLAVAEAPFTAAEIELVVIGRAPSAFARELAEKFKYCRFLGHVEDIHPLLVDARIGVNPDDLGGGFKHKNLLYIFSGLPVAAIRTQLMGLPLDIDHDVLSADTHAGIVQAVVGAMDDLPRLNGMRERSWNACSKAFDWGDRGRRLGSAIEDVLELRRAQRGTADHKACAAQ